MTLDIQALEEVFARYPGVQAVYLFGSHAAGTARPGSDVDLAVVPRDASVREQRLEILTDLVRAGIEHVDLVFLDADDLILLYEAVRYNRVVYQTADFERGTFYSYVIRRYFDFLPYLERQRAAYKRRLLNDQT
ncbi:MAG: type VII toxin-antitoxin system MntA family adenylyltransferase antitoxin [Anaerolineae bacterium]